MPGRIGEMTAAGGPPAAAHAAHATHVTPLRFVGMPDGVAARRRRLGSLSDGWKLSGNLETLGYFAADVCVGQPKHEFRLIVDTGSSLTALPCSDCSHCGQHHSGARLDISDSATGEQLKCAGAPASSCPRCGAGGTCVYSVSYTEGSTIRGKIVRERVLFAHSTGAVPVPAYIGCQTYESGLFYTQQVEPAPCLSRACPCL